jgi:hypothetical protein
MARVPLALIFERKKNIMAEIAGTQIFFYLMKGKTSLTIKNGFSYGGVANVFQRFWEIYVSRY